MPLRELLDELLTSLETGPLITAVRHFEARPAVFAPFPVVARSTHRRGAAGAWDQQLYSHQAKAFDIVAKGEHLVMVTPTASGKTLCYNLPVLQTLVQQPEARVLYLFPTKALAQDQLAELTELAEVAPRSADVHLRRRHAAGRAAGGAGARQPRADQSRHAALGNPAAPHQVGEPLPEPALRGDRRAARVSRGVRQPPRQCAAPAQAHLPPLRLDAAVHHGLRHHRESRASWRSGSPARR